MGDPGKVPERLDSWKEIAAHLAVSVRTAQRWAEAENLPARRHRGGPRGSVFAYRSELESWLANRPHLRGFTPETPPAAPSIAVLPFLDLNQDEENEIFCDGLTEELINALAQVPQLRVVARTSTFQFKGKAADVRSIGGRLGVRTVLEGSVRRTGDRLRITAQLINAADGCHFWSQRYDRMMQGVFELQEELANGIVEALQASLGGGRRIRRPHGADLETYRLYLEGRYHWNKRTRAGILAGVECFERVLARDSGMALAWAGLADCYLMGGLAGVPLEEALRKGRAAARQALELDGTLAEVHTTLAFTFAVFDYDWVAAEAGFRRALELNPNCANAHLLYAAVVLSSTGRLDEAFDHQRRALELDPLSAVMTSAMGTCYLMMRRFDQTISACRRALELDPAYPWAQRWLGEAYLLKGGYEEAEDAFSRIEAPMFAAGLLGYCYARTNREVQAREIVARLQYANSPTLGLQLAILHLGLGDQESALDCLKQACDAHVPGVNWLKIEPIWDGLRTQRRFADLLESVRLAG
jgi:TolB-like protein/Flp pilus assembly protein TadD